MSRHRRCAPAGGSSTVRGCPRSRSSEPAATSSRSPWSGTSWPSSRCRRVRSRLYDIDQGRVAITAAAGRAPDRRPRARRQADRARGPARGAVGGGLCHLHVPGRRDRGLQLRRQRAPRVRCRPARRRHDRPRRSFPGPALRRCPAGDRGRHPCGLPRRSAHPVRQPDVDQLLGVVLARSEDGRFVPQRATHLTRCSPGRSRSPTKR